MVVGARSALFLPYARLGLIVVDEAHEISFKQDDGVRYNARDVAVMRARFEQVPVVLASATPALESLQMAESGIYEKLVLPSRFGGAQMPAIETIDLTEEKPERGRWLAPRLVEALRERLCARRAVAAVSQPPRLRPADSVPQLRLPLPMPELQRLAGRAPAEPPARLPPLRA